MNRKIMINLFLIAVFLMFSRISFAQTSSYEHWAMDALNELTINPAISDYSSVFSIENLDEPISVGELSFVINRIIFQDSANSMSGELELLQNRGFLNESDGFMDKITREETAFLMANVLSLDDYHEKSTFVDEDEISSWFSRTSCCYARYRYFHRLS